MVNKGLVTNYGEGGGLQREGGTEVLPLLKGEGGKSLSHADGGWGAKSFGVVFTWSLMTLAILKGGTNSFHALKRGGGERFYPVLRGAGHKKFQTCDFPIL